MTQIPDDIGIGELKEILKVKTDQAVYALMKRDPSFPRPGKVGRYSRWVREDVSKWYAAQLGKASDANAKRLADAKGGRHA